MPTSGSSLLLFTGMSSKTTSAKTPEFLTGQDKKPSVLISQADYLSLLIKAGITDPQLWPPGKQDGAGLIARIREIEAAELASSGRFDWEALSPELQDEYDAACNALDGLIDPDDQGEDAAGFFAKLKGA
ncbi:hypothetical protein IT575_09655 [bacterium]|nr:hypothetical protein [bacterium]